jgi:hypothetical protein
MGVQDMTDQEAAALLRRLHQLAANVAGQKSRFARAVSDPEGIPSGADSGLVVARPSRGPGTAWCVEMSVGGADVSGAVCVSAIGELCRWHDEDWAVGKLDDHAGDVAEED